MKIMPGNIDDKLADELIQKVRQGRHVKSRLLPQLQAFMDSDYSYARFYYGDKEYKNVSTCVCSVRSRIKDYGYSNAIYVTSKDGIVYLVKKYVVEKEEDI